MLRCASVGLCFVRQVVFLLLLLGGFDASAHPQSFPAQPSRPGAQQRLRQEMSFRRGRLPRGKAAREAAATLLQRAYQQKLSLRRKTVSAYGASSASSPSGKPWSSLGPAPLLSNASGSLGEQDYGPVSGRVTAIAVDPNDASGNTVYVGGLTAESGNPLTRPQAMPQQSPGRRSPTSRPAWRPEPSRYNPGTLR